MSDEIATSLPPSRNPANENSLAGVMAIVLKKFLQGVDDMLPARVISYDRASNRAQVQPMIKMVTTGNVLVDRGQVASIPVLILGGGGFLLSFPLNPGDLGWIKACDRDISLFKQTYQNAQPNTVRQHSFSDAMFIPDVMHAYTIAAEDEPNAVWQNMDATVKIALWDSFIKIIAPRVGIGGTPDANAILDLQSTAKAFIPPRMTTGQRDAIPSPKEGMIIWNLSVHSLQSYNGSTWG